MKSITKYVEYEDSINRAVKSRFDLNNYLASISVDSYEYVDAEKAMGYTKKMLCSLLIGVRGVLELESTDLVDGDFNIKDAGYEEAAIDLWNMQICPIHSNCFTLADRPRNSRDYMVIGNSDFESLVTNVYCFMYELTGSEVGMRNNIVTDVDEIVLRAYEAYGRDRDGNPIVSFYDMWKYGTEERTLGKLVINL